MRCVIIIYIAISSLSVCSQQFYSWLCKLIKCMVGNSKCVNVLDIATVVVKLLDC